MQLFDQIPWALHLAQIQTAQEAEIYFSPSLQIMNEDNQHALDISAIDGTEWYIFYTRPKVGKRFFGFSDLKVETYCTEALGQTEKDVRDCLEALIRNDLQFLEDKIK